MVIMIVSPLSFFAQQAGSNYVRTIVPRTGSTAEPSDNPQAASGINPTSPKVTTAYVDGLGRKRSDVASASGGSGEDVCDLVEYDNYGNAVRQWAPFAVSGSGDALSVNALKQAAYSFHGSDEVPFVETTYEDGATNRPVAQSHLGRDWNPLNARKRVTTDYIFNESNSPEYKDVRLFAVGSDGRSLSDNGYYRPFTLRATCVTDEDGHKTVTFRTKADRTVLTRRVGDDGQLLDTYFVYDIYGCLKYMLSPKAVEELPHNASCPAATLEKLCYFYDYDARRRLVEKRLPGCEPVYYVYDKLNRPVFTQDGNQRSGGEWTVTAYHPHNLKVALVGTSVMPTATRQSLQTAWGDTLLLATASPSSNYEPDLLYPPLQGVGTFTPKVAYFYDNFAHWNGTLPSDPDFPYNASDSHQGMLTGTAFYDDGQTMVSAVFADKKGRVVMSAEKDYYSNYYSVATFSAYCFDGRLIRQKSVYNELAEGMSISSHTTETENDYDSGDRVVATRMRVDGGQWHTLTANTYDALGRLSSSTFGGSSSGLQPVTFVHDICGNLTETHSPWFDQKVYLTSSPNAEACGSLWGLDFGTSFSGNVNGADESSLVPAQNAAGYGKTARSYAYAHDALNRIVAVGEADDHLGGTFEYDENGNITALVRTYDSDFVQDAAIGYDGNRLSAVYDDGDDYHVGTVPQFISDDYTGFTYDANGNLTADPTRQITSILYEPLVNLPRRVNFANGNYMLWGYRSDGAKTMSQTRTKYITLIPKANGDTIQRVNYHTATERFFGPFVKIDNSRWRVYHQSGHVDITSAGVQTWAYYVRDRLGSTRVVISAQGVPLQAFDYYPSGIPVETYNTNNTYAATNRLHTGKEFHPFDGLSWHDNAARFHDTLFPRFTTVDPLAEKDPGTSPYAYCGNNPLRFIDPTGKRILINNIDYAGYHDNCNDDLFVKEMANVLDMIRQNGGEEVVNDLMNSGTNYIFRPTDEANSYTSAKSDGNGNPIGDVEFFIRDKGDARVLANDGAHELFHGVQYENGQGGETVFNEVEAYAFQDVIIKNAHILSSATPWTGDNENEFEKAFIDITEGKYGMLSKAVELFKTSNFNKSGKYDDIPNLITGKINISLLDKYKIKQ